MEPWDAEDFYDDDIDDDCDFDYYESDTEQKQIPYRLILKLKRVLRSTCSYLRGISFESTNVTSFENAHRQAIDFVSVQYPGWKIIDYRSADIT